MARVLATLSIALLSLFTAIAYGQNYPNKPIRIITSSIGGGNNFQARMVAQGITGPLGQPVIVDNRGGNLPSEMVAKAPADGHTLLIEGGDLWILPLLQKVSYDPLADFAPITMLSREASILIVHPQVPVKSVKELIALAKAKPGQLNFASGSTGSGSHLAGELFKSMAGINIVRVGYKGSGAALTELIAGQTQMMFASSGSAMPHVKSGKVTALAVASAQPTPLAPGLPTVSATGLPGYEVASTSGAFAPARTSGAIIKRLNEEIVRFLNTPDVKEKFLAFGMETAGGSPEMLSAAMKSEMATLGKVIKDAGIKVE